MRATQESNEEHGDLFPLPPFFAKILMPRLGHLENFGAWHAGQIQPQSVGHVLLEKIDGAAKFGSSSFENRLWGKTSPPWLINGGGVLS